MIEQLSETTNRNEILLLPFFYPVLHKMPFRLLRVSYRIRRRCPRRLILEEPVLVPVMYRTCNQNEWLIDGVCVVPRPCFRRMSSRGTPRILFAIQEG